MLWRRSAHSTSSTSLPTHPREELDLSPLAIVNSIHSAVIAKSYQGKSSTDPSAIEMFSDRLSRRVQCEVRAISRGSHLDTTVDWEASVFRPIIATFDIQKDSGICQGDAEYVFLLATLLMLAYELLWMAGKSEAPKARSFLTRSFSECFIEPEICYNVSEMFESERKRLAGGVAEMKILRAIQHTQILLPDIDFCTAAWSTSMAPRAELCDSVFRRFTHILAKQTTNTRVSRWSKETSATAKSRKSRKTVSFALPQSPASNLEDVQVKVFLKPGRSWPFNSVTSIEFHGDSATIKASAGLVMQVESGCSISTSSGKSDTVVVTMPRNSTDGFTATVIIPRGCVYQANNVHDIKENIEAQGWTTIRAADAVLEVGDGPYLVQREYFQCRAFIQNTSRQPHFDMLV
jgi:hypothetical protein